MVSRDDRTSSDDEYRRKSASTRNHRDRDEKYRDRSPRPHRDSEPRDRRRRQDYTPSDDEDRHRATRQHSDDRRKGSERRHRDRSYSPSKKRPRRSTSRSGDDHTRRKPSRRSRSPAPNPRSNKPLPSQNDSFRAIEGGDGAPTPVEKEKPNFKPTGLLAKEANTVAGTTTVLKYHEPAEARKPGAKDQWRMYVFKGKDLLDTVHLFQRSCWLVGRDANVTDLRLEHPSVSKQHAVIQFRHTVSVNEFGDRTNRVKPYLIDLESANGTVLNGKKVEESRYVELVDGDVVRFGESEREYVMMLPPPEKKEK